MYKFREYSDNYLKTSRSWNVCSCRDEPALKKGDVVEFTANNATTDSFKLKKKQQEKQVINAREMLK